MPETNTLRIAFAASCALAGACASNSPIVLSSTFQPPFGPSWTYVLKRGEQVSSCRVAIGEVTDTRSDKESMGEVGGRYIRAENAVGWIRSGLDSLKLDQRIQFVDAADPGADLVLAVELMKAYAQSASATKNANVVVRARYSRNGAQIGERTFRGDDSGANWASMDGEGQGVLNQALKEVIASLDYDLLQRCTANRAAPSAATAAPAAAQ